MTAATLIDQGMILQALGGLGLFLLGMIIMTEGLRALAGDAIRAALMRFTTSPASGAVTGAISTAILQSSSATTVAAVGFVGAGLMTFTASLGIIFGANIGTTITGWMVALLGFKLKLTLVMLPMILVGVILRLFARGKWATSGYTLAGFGLIFVGIGMMQEGMSGMQGLLTPETLPEDTWLGRIQIMLLGAVATLVTQSSSASIAATLTALHANAISFEQALALVVGMDIGTTVTALLATIGGTTSARRTGISHMLYNLMTGVGALLLITPYLMALQYFLPNMLADNAEISLVAFHTLFNLLGVILILPFTPHFANLVRRLVPDRGASQALELNDELLETPVLALTAVQRATLHEYSQLLNHVNAIVHADHPAQRTDLARMQVALDETHAYLDAIQVREGDAASRDRLLDLLHTLDHLQRLHERCEEDEDRAITAREAANLLEMRSMLSALVNETIVHITGNGQPVIVRQSLQTAEAMNAMRTPQRDLIATSVADGDMDVPEATDCLEAIRWMSRVAHHIARINYHMHRALLDSGK